MPCENLIIYNEKKEINKKGDYLKQKIDLTDPFWAQSRLFSLTSAASQ
jgi:hypothetical protein